MTRKDNFTSENFSPRKRMRSFKYAFSGLFAIFKREHNVRIHFIAAILAIALGIVLKISRVEWTVLIIAIGLVFITELINSAIEELSDFVSSDHNEHIKRVKDYSAAAVLVASIVSLVMGLIIFLPRILILI